MKDFDILILVLIIVVFYHLVKSYNYVEGFPNSTDTQEPRNCSDEESKTYILDTVSIEDIDNAFDRRLTGRENMLNVWNVINPAFPFIISFISLGSYLKIPGLDYRDALDDDVINMYTDMNKLYDYYKNQNNETLNKVIELCGERELRVFSFKFISMEALQTTDKDQIGMDLPALFLSFYNKQLKDKQLIINIIINSTIYFFILIGAFKGKDMNYKKKLISSIRSVFTRLNEIKIFEYLRSLYTVYHTKDDNIGRPDYWGKLFENITPLKEDEMNVEEEKICNFIKTTGIFDLNYDGDDFRLNIDGTIFKISVIPFIHYFGTFIIIPKIINIPMSPNHPNQTAKLDKLEFETIKSSIISLILNWIYESKIKANKLVTGRKEPLPNDLGGLFKLLDYGLPDILSRVIKGSSEVNELSDVSEVCKKNTSCWKSEVCSKNTVWNMRTNKCDRVITKDVCGESTKFNPESSTCDRVITKDVCGESTEWDPSEEKCFTDLKDVCGESTKFNPESSKCEKDGWCAIM